MVLMLGAGLATGSLGLVSAGVESTGDVVAAVVTFFAVRLGARPADSSHPYGHRRAENLSALAEATILVGGGLFVAIEAIGRLSGGESLAAKWYVFVVIGVAIAINLSRALLLSRSARRYHSAALRSNSFHFAGDVAGSVAVLAGLILVRAGFPDGDPIAALIVAVIIFAAAGRLVFENAQVLMDTAPAGAQAIAREAIAALGPEIELDRLRLRESAGRYFADVVVAVPPGRAVVEGHAAADEVEQAVEHALPTATSSSTSSRAAADSPCATASWRSRSASRPSARRTTSRSSSTATRSASRCTSSSPPTAHCRRPTTSPSASKLRSARCRASATLSRISNRSNDRSRLTPRQPTMIAKLSKTSRRSSASRPERPPAMFACCPPTPESSSSSPFRWAPPSPSLTRIRSPASSRRPCASECPRSPTSSCTRNREARVRKAVVVGGQRGPVPVLLAAAVGRSGDRPRCREPVWNPCLDGFRLR